MNTNSSIPAISVIVPIYNVEEYLTTCLESIVNQSLKEIEIICVNDGSEDGSLRILNEFAEKDDRIVVLSGPNKGYGHAINSGIEVATGEYIGIVESDDFILEEMYESLYSVAKEYPTVDIIKSNLIRFFGDGLDDDCSIVHTCKSHLYNRVIQMLEEPDVFDSNITNQTGIYKRELFEQYNIRLNESKGAAFQDNGLWFQLFTRASSIYFLNKEFYMYRMDREESSTNGTSFENAMCIFSEWDFIYNTMNKYNTIDKETSLPIYVNRFVCSAFYHFKRVRDEYKSLFLKKFSDEINRISDNGELYTELLKPYQIKALIKIKENPQLYFYEWCNKNIKEYLDKEEAKQIEIVNKRIIDRIIVQNDPRLFDKECFGTSHAKISIIIPVYNAESDLDQCFMSIFNQTLKDIEIVCVDDGSTDQSLSLLICYALRDKRIKVISQKNAGAGIARNEGIRIASGDYLAFLDADDKYPSNDVLECLYNSAKNSGCYICGGNICINNNGVIENENDKDFCEDGVVNYSEYQKDYGFYRFIYYRQYIVDNDIFFPVYRRYQDPPFFVKAMAEAGEFYAICKDVYQYNWDPAHIEWTPSKIINVICGITDCIRLSKEYCLPNLHYESVRRLEVSFKERIVNAAIKDSDVLRYLFLAESEIDIELLKKSDSMIVALEEKYHLKIIDSCFSKIQKNIPRGYVGPYSRKVKTECFNLVVQIIEIETSISYRIGMILAGGRASAIKRGEWYDSTFLMTKTMSDDINILSQNKSDLEGYLQSLFESKCFKRGHLFGGKKRKGCT